MLGDSILWENPAIAGQISATIGAVPSSMGATAPGIDGFPGRTFDQFMNGQNGSTYLPVSAAVLSDVDLLVIALGTNQDSSAGLGSVTDAPSLNGTMSAQMRSMLETIMGWKPGMRIIVVGPYQTNRYNVQAGPDGLLGSQDATKSIANSGSLAVLRNINMAMKAVCNLYGIPYVDMYDESGVNFTTSALWLTDGLHPNALGYSTFYAPYIAAQLARYAQ
jgi:lysophospholipase L1-like esterase